MERESVMGKTMTELRREIEYAAATERIVWDLGDLNLEVLSHKQLVQRIKSLNRQALRASEKYRGF